MTGTKDEEEGTAGSPRVLGGKVRNLDITLKCTGGCQRAKNNLIYIVFGFIFNLIYTVFMFCDFFFFNLG